MSPFQRREERGSRALDSNELLGRYANGERNFRSANLGGANTCNTDLKGANLQEADFNGADLRDADLRDADLRGANLTCAILTNTDLCGASLTSANLTSANLGGAKLGDTDLTSANLTGANLFGAMLVGAHLHAASFGLANLRRAKLGGTDLSGTNFGGANLRGAHLLGARLRGANLRGADLRDAILAHADITGADLRGADLRGANLASANLGGANILLADFNNAKFNDTVLVGIDLGPIARATIDHGGPSWVDWSAVVRSLNEPLLKDLLRRAGMPDVFVEYMVDCARSLEPEMIFSLLQSTFISYGGPDEAFAKKLNEALERRGVMTFFFKDDAPPGERLHRVMRKGVNDHDRTILICSEASLQRPGLLNELEETLAREARDGGQTYLIPVRLDDYVLKGWAPKNSDLARTVRDRVISDFRMHEVEAEFDAEVAKLIAVLKKPIAGK